MKFLLYLNPWKLFLIFIICIIFSISSTIGTAVDLICWIIYMAWIYHIGVAIHGLLPIKLKPDIKYFKFSCLFIPFVGLILTVVSLLEAMLNFTIPQLPYTVNLVITIILLGYTFWSWLYISMFAARMLESMIEGKLVNKSDSLKGFVYLLFFPLGVWYIQPAVQRVLKKYATPPMNY